MLTDDDRIKAAKIAYNASIKKLKNLRRKNQIEFATEELPPEISVGDMVLLTYDNKLYIVEDCSEYEKMVMQYNDWFYVTKITYHFNEAGAEYDEVTLEKELRVDRMIEDWS